jgi:hypothetical protein
LYYRGLIPKFPNTNPNPTRNEVIKLDRTGKYVLKLPRASNKDKELDQRPRQQNDATQRPDTNKTSETEGKNGPTQDYELGENTAEDNVVEPSQRGSPTQQDTDLESTEKDHNISYKSRHLL